MSLRIILLILFSFSFSLAQSSKLTKSAEYLVNKNNVEKYWIKFSDKGLNKTNVKPESVLSRKAIQRRLKVRSENNVIDYADLSLNKKYIEAVSLTGVTIESKSKWFNSVAVMADAEQIQKLSQLPFIEKIDAVKKYKVNKPEAFAVKANQLPKKTAAKKSSNFDYGFSYTQVSQIKIPELHDKGLSGKGVVIGVLDAGFDMYTTHEVFQSMDIHAAYDFVNNDEDVENGQDMGTGSHGTAVLSILGGFKEEKLIGPAYGATFLLAKTENTFSETPLEEDNWIEAIEWMDSIGVDVTSTSLGYLDFDTGFMSYTWEDLDGNTAKITKAADMAAARGIVVVTSAGNNGYHPEHNTLGAPADGDSVISVAAVDSDGDRVGFSSVGLTADGRIKPDVAALGTGDYHAVNSTNTSYGFGGGTSYSCPLVSGVVALMLENDSTLTPYEIMTALHESGNQKNNPDRLLGWGIINGLIAAGFEDTSVSDGRNTVPNEYVIINNYPNPFNPGTIIRFNLPSAAQVTFTLYDALGRNLGIIENSYYTAGEKEFEFIPQNMASGIYFVRMTAGGKSDYKKIVFQK